MLWNLYFLLILSFRKCDSHNEQTDETDAQATGPHSARRILRGTEASETRPYMVYLRPAASTSTYLSQPDSNWLCGGVIIQPRFILTSAACIEDTVHFYVVSGTHKCRLLNRWVQPSETNECIENGAMRAIWKCIPKTYIYDAIVPNNIRWMVNDIAVVETEETFNFEKRVKGCDFIPQMIAYNNISEEMEKAGTTGSIAGWGSTDSYTDFTFGLTRTGVNSPELMEADVFVIRKGACKSFWLPRYHEIIEKEMICGKSVTTDEMSEACATNHVQCRQLLFPEEEQQLSRRLDEISDHQLLQSLADFNKMRKARREAQRRGGTDDYGGFCENDHGGPLTVGQGKSSVVIGIMTAYRTMNHSTRCAGPFLYTSVWNNRNLIHCALYKELGSTCRTVLRTSSTVLDEELIDWTNKEGTRKPRRWEKITRAHESNENTSKSIDTESNSGSDDTSNSDGSDEHDFSNEMKLEIKRR